MFAELKIFKTQKHGDGIALTHSIATKIKLDDLNIHNVSWTHQEANIARPTTNPKSKEKQAPKRYVEIYIQK